MNNTVIVLNAYEDEPLHSRDYSTKFTGDTSCVHYYYYADYNGYEDSGYYLDDHKAKW